MKELLEKLVKGEVTTDDVIAQIEDSKKDMIPRSRLNDKNDEIKELKAEIKQRDEQITTLEQSAKGNEELTKQLEDLKQQNAGWEEKYKETQLNNAIKLAVAKEANDASDVLYFINKEGLELQEDGTVKGLEEGLTALKESKPYLFAQQQQPQAPVLQGRTPNLEGGAKHITQRDEVQKQYEQALSSGKTALAVSLKNKLFNMREDD